MTGCEGRFQGTNGPSLITGVLRAYDLVGPPLWERRPSRAQRGQGAALRAEGGEEISESGVVACQPQERGVGMECIHADATMPLAGYSM